MTKLSNKQKYFLLVFTVLVIFLLIYLSENWFENCEKGFEKCNAPIYNTEEEKLKCQILLRDNCYSEMARKNGNYKICDKISNNTKKNFCKIRLFNDKNYMDICNEVNMSFEACYIEYVSVTKKTDYTLCDSLSGTSTDACLMAVSLNSAESGDGNYCDRIANITLRDDCYTVVAHGTKNASLCEKAVTTMTNTIIINEILVNITISAREHCYELIAVITKNSSYCSILVNSTLRERCINITKSRT